MTATKIIIGTPKKLTNISTEIVRNAQNDRIANSVPNDSLSRIKAESQNDDKNDISNRRIVTPITKGVFRSRTASNLLLREEALCFGRQR